MNKIQVKVTIFGEYGEQNVHNLVVTEEQIKVFDWLCHTGDIDLDYERLDEIELTDLT